MKRKKKEDLSVDTLILLRRGNKILTEGVIETKCGAETEGMTIQRLFLSTVLQRSFLKGTLQ